MKTKPLFIIVILLFTGITCLFAQVVDNQLGTALKRTFPELSQGYIDLNDNGEKDQSPDLDETIPESRMRDSTIQVQEILNFIITQYRFIPLSKLYEVKENLENASGEIPELISLSYTERIEEIISLKEELGEEGIFLTPSALRDAMEKMEGYIARMVLAYKKEGRASEEDFIDARDNLFTMIEKGYPFPENLNPEDRDVLVSSMINTIRKYQDRDEERVNAAVKTLGRLKAENAVPYITEIFSRESYKKESIGALGAIGSRQAMNLLVRELSEAKDTESRINIIKALGKIGGEESLNEILAILPEKDDENTDPAVEAAALQSLVSLSAHGTTDTKIYGVFEKYLSAPEPEFRSIAIRGLSYFATAKSSDLLLDLLKTEKDEEVMIQIIQSINAIGANSAVPALSLLLKDESISENVRIEIITALGENEAGTKSLVYLIPNLSSPSDSVREAVQNALINLYTFDSKSVIGYLARGLMGSTDENYLESGTSVLARLADADSVNTLYALLQKPYPEVKKNVTWALFRIRAPGNPRLADELNKLVTSETEPIDVRINAVRALGAMGFDSANLNIWQTLVTTAKMRGEKYVMLRFFAIRALGELGTINDEIIDALVIIASRDQNQEIKKEALNTLRALSAYDVSMAEGLSSLFYRLEDSECRVRIIEILGDMGAEDTSVLARAVLLDNRKSIEKELKLRIIYALSRAGSDDAFSTILDAASDQELAAYILGVMEGADKKILEPIVSRRIKTENNPDILSLLESIQDSMSAQF